MSQLTIDLSLLIGTNKSDTDKGRPLPGATTGVTAEGSSQQPAVDNPIGLIISNIEFVIPTSTLLLFGTLCFGLLSNQVFL